MKKLKLGKLNLLSEEVIHRSQLAAIYGGSGSGGSQCCVYYRDSSSNSYIGSSCNNQDGQPITYHQATEWYHMAQGSQTNGAYYVSGYCCTSCTN